MRSVVVPTTAYVGWHCTAPRPVRSATAQQLSRRPHKHPHPWQRHVPRITRCRATLDDQAPGDDDAAAAAAFETSCGVVAPLPAEQAEVDYLGESTIGDLHFVQAPATPTTSRTRPVIDLGDPDKVLATPFADLKAATADVMQGLSIFDDASTYPDGNPLRAVFCSRTLNLRSIQAIGIQL